MADEAKLPHYLLHSYRAYKRSTKIVKDWLLEHGGTGDKAPSVRDLVRCAENVNNNAVKTPNDVLRALKNTIRSRTEINSFFQGQRNAEPQKTSSHDYFTTSLRYIHSLVSGEAEQTPESSLSALTLETSVKTQFPPLSTIEHTSGSATLGSQNRFAPLHDIPQQQSEDRPAFGDKIHVQNEKKEPDRNQSSSSTTEKGNVDIADDDLAHLLDLYFGLLDWDGFCSVAKLSWEHAADSSIPMVVSSFLTNAAWKSISMSEEQMRYNYNMANPEELEDVYVNLKGRGGVPDLPPAYTPTFQGHTKGCVLGNSWEALVNFKKTHGLKIRTPGARSTFQEPTKHIVQQNADQDTKDQAAKRHILASVKYLIASFANHQHHKHQYSNFFISNLPIHNEFKIFLDSGGKTGGLACALGLTLLHETFKSHLYGSESGSPMNQTNCRLEALQFAGQMAHSLALVLKHSSFPCVCHWQIAKHLELLFADLKTYTEEKVFDLFYQAPWVSGTHMLSMLNLSFRYGLHLCNHSNIVGEIPVLEKLCELFLDAVFIGSRPKSKFMTRWVRFMGGPLVSESYRGSHRRRSDQGMEVVRIKCKTVDGLRVERNDNRFDPEKLSLFHTIHHKNYQIDDNQWTDIYGIRKGKKATVKEISEARRLRNEAPMSSHRLSQLQKAALREFEREFPVAKVNFFAVYLACAQIYEMVNMAYHANVPDEEKFCNCHVRRVLENADEFYDTFDVRVWQPIKEPVMLEDWQFAVHSVMAGKSMEDFLWKLS